MSHVDGFKIEVIRHFSEQVLRDILTAYRRGMPWHFNDAEEYLREMLLDGECVHVLLRKGDAPAGYILAKPHVSAARDAELLEADPHFMPDPERYYIETAEIVPEVRNTIAGGKMFYRMLHAMIDEVKRRFGINKFSMHVRVGNGASRAVQRYFGDMITPIRRIENWRFYSGEDAADYLEGTYTGDGGSGLLIKRARKVWCDAEIYTPLEDAKEEILQRWIDEGLRSRVKQFLCEIPEVFQGEPRAVLFRHIITPNKEYRHFLSVARNATIKPLGWEFLEDHFCTRNPDKVALLKMPFLQKRNVDEHAAKRYKRIADLSTSHKKRLNQITVCAGEALVDFHHRLLQRFATTIEIFDASPWYRAHGKMAKEYYKYFLALFICHGILFENFITNEEEERFSKTVVMPAYREVVSRFGVKPLIVQLLPPEIAGDDYWRSYPEELMEEVEKCLAKKSIQTQCT